MADTLLALIAAHLLADFPFQTGWILRRKKNLLVLLLHIFVVVGTTAALLGGTPWLLLAILAGTHLFMDAIKIYLLKDTLKAFIGDQLFHLVVMAVLAIIYPHTFAGGAWSKLPSDFLVVYMAGLCLAAGIILSLQTGGIVIKKATAKFVEEIGPDIAGLHHGGTYIGYLERALVMLLVLMNQPTGVGFLITAKSILRFGDVKESHQRKLTEYVIIGTFMSFGWGLLIAALTQTALKHWMP